MPLVSVVIPVYNPGNFLKRSLAGVLGQTFTDLECVVVDDGSTEDVTQIRELDDPRVRLIRQPNRGVSVARNMGVESSNSKYVAFLDQDDEWLPPKLERQVVSLERRPEAAFSHTPFVWMLPSGEVPSGPPPLVTYYETLAGMNVCLSSIVVDRVKHDAVGGHNPLLAQAQDWDYVLRLLLVFGEAVGEGEHLVRYFVHGGNVSSDYWAAERETRTIGKLHLARATRVGDDLAVSAIMRSTRVARSLHAHQAMDQMRASVRDHDWREASVHLGRGLSLDPAVPGRFGLTAASSRGRDVWARIRQS